MSVCSALEGHRPELRRTRVLIETSERDRLSVRRNAGLDATLGCSATLRAQVLLPLPGRFIEKI